MIKKQSIFYGLIFLILTSMGQQAHAMKWTKHQWSNGFRIGMKGLNYTGVGLYFIGSLKQKEERQKDMVTALKTRNEILDILAKLDGDYADRNLSKESQDKILRFIRHAYPELEDTEIQIIENSPRSFGTFNCNNVVYLLVPFNEQEFQKALLCKEKNIPGYTRKTASNERWKERLTLPQYISKCEITGKAMTQTTLDLWQASMLHEASHILHKDNNDSNNPMPYLMVLIGTEKIKKLLGLDTFKWCKNLIANNLIRGTGSLISLPIKIGACELCLLAIKYWDEYRADQEMMERTQNPNLLKAAIYLFDNFPNKAPSTTLEKRDYYLDPHPNLKTRAAYFAKGTQKIENKQQETMEALAYYMSGDDIPRKD